MAYLLKKIDSVKIIGFRTNNNAIQNKKGCILVSIHDLVRLPEYLTPEGEFELNNCYHYLLSDAPELQEELAKEYNEFIESLPQEEKNHGS